jgi:ribosomal protein S18 acetylase RimI-like enzyme
MPNPKTIPIRKMEPQDVADCISLRTQTRENRWSLEALTQAGITEPSVIKLLASTHQGWVCEQDSQIVGFSMADRSTGELWVVAVLPSHEGRGIGARLVEAAQSWLHSQGSQQIWLWTSPDTTTRAYHLYKKLGWQDCGVKNNQLIMRRTAP